LIDPSRWSKPAAVGPDRQRHVTEPGALAPSARWSRTWRGVLGTRSSAADHLRDALSPASSTTTASWYDAPDGDRPTTKSPPRRDGSRGELAPDEVLPGDRDLGHAEPPGGKGGRRVPGRRRRCAPRRLPGGVERALRPRHAAPRRPARFGAGAGARVDETGVLEALRSAAAYSSCRSDCNVGGLTVRRRRAPSSQSRPSQCRSRSAPSLASARARVASRSSIRRINSSALAPRCQARRSGMSGHGRDEAARRRGSQPGPRSVLSGWALRSHESSRLRFVWSPNVRSGLIVYRDQRTTAVASLIVTGRAGSGSLSRGYGAERTGQERDRADRSPARLYFDLGDKQVARPRHARAGEWPARHSWIRPGRKAKEVIKEVQSLNAVLKPLRGAGPAGG